MVINVLLPCLKRWRLKEKLRIALEALGATIIQTFLTEVIDFDDPSHISVLKKLNKDDPNSHILDQYGNQALDAHLNGTAGGNSS